jgi:hypothetical protein
MNNPYLIDIPGGMVRWAIKSRTSAYKMIAELAAKGIKAAVKHDRRTKLIVPVIDEYLASLPSPNITTGQNTNQPPSPWQGRHSASPTITTSAAPERRRRGRPRKLPAPSPAPTVAAPPVQSGAVTPTKFSPAPAAAARPAITEQLPWVTEAPPSAAGDNTPGEVA